MFSAKGDLGMLRVGYQQAAMLRNWFLTCNKETATLHTLRSSVSVIVDSVNEFWITQSPMRLGLKVGNSWWIWELVAVPHHSQMKVRAQVSLVVTGDPAVLNTF